MKTLFASLFWLASLSLIAQSAHTFDVAGTLNLIDRPPEATPVEALTFQIRPLTGGFDVSATPDKDGRFVLRKTQPGRYSLVFPMPGRIEVFAIGARQLTPEDFELSSNDPGPISIVVSMKSATVAVRVSGVLNDKSDAIALLVPADNRLTLRESCYSNRLTGPETDFRFVPPGKYRLVVFNSKYLRDVSAYAPRVPAFLDRESVEVDASPEHEATATASFIKDETIEAAIREAGGPFDPFKNHMRNN
jgi:hypothetical protein